MKYKTLTALLILCMATANAFAQATVEMTETTDFIPGDDQRRDYSNNPCALLKVQVLDEITDVEGNVMGDIVHRGVEKWVYMAQGSRNMKIHFKNNIPVRVMFKDYNINGLVGNRVYSVVIDVPNKQKENISLKGNNLQMKVIPANSNVYIWGDNFPKKAYRPDNDGQLKVYLPYGRYNYRVSANGHHDAEGSIFVDDNDNWESVELSPILGTLIIACPTDKAEFYIDNELVMRNNAMSSWTDQRAPGEYLVRVTKKGYVAAEKRVEVFPEQTVTVNFDRLVSMAEVEKLEKEKLNEEKRLQQLRQKAVNDSIKMVNDSINRAIQDSIAKENMLLKRMKDSIEHENQVKQELLRKLKRAEQEEIRKQKMDSLVAKLKRKEEQPLVYDIVAGYNIATAKFNSDGGDTGSIGGIHLGMTLDARLASGFYFETGLIFSSKGYTYKGSMVEETATAQFVDIPIQALIRISLSRQTKWQLNAGPYLGICIGGKVKDDLYGSYDESFSSAYSGIDYGVQLGTRMLFRHHYHVGISYQVGMGSSYQNRNLMLGVGYCF